MERSDHSVFMPTERPPAGYPEIPVPDSFSPAPFRESFDERRQAFLAHCLKNPSPHGRPALFHELVRTAAGIGPIHERRWEEALDVVQERHEGSGLILLGILRFLYQYPASPLVTRELSRRMEESVLFYAYGPDEPGLESMSFWTESNRLMLSVAEYLAGRLYPGRTFHNSGRTGEQKRGEARERILRWLELRFAVGMSEWLSEDTYDECMTALLALIDFSNDAELTVRARMILDLLVFDLSLYGSRGTYGPSQGRAEHRRLRTALPCLMSDTLKLLFGTGVFTRMGNTSAVSFALSSVYRMPGVFYLIANNAKRREVVSMQRTGLRVKDGSKLGIDFGKPENGLELLSFEDFAQPDLFPLTMRLFDRFGLWRNESFRGPSKRKALLRLLGVSWFHEFLPDRIREDLSRNAKEENNLYQYRTGDYQLSTSQSYRKGRAGSGFRIWQASLGDAVCFTSHPGNDEPGSDGYWAGTGLLPRAAQVRNVVIVLYRLSGVRGLLSPDNRQATHAWFPRSLFDDRFEQGGWIFGRKAEGYIALFSARGYRWQDSGPDAGNEVIAEGGDNFWICELGNAEKNGSFRSFMDAILGSMVEHRGLRVRYRSPSLGLLEFGWNERLRRNGLFIPLAKYNRYENPYCLASWPAKEITIREKASSLTLNFSTGTRNVSGTL